LNENPGTVLRFRVTPRAKRNEISQVLADGTIKVRLTAPPVEGKANRALIQFLAEVFDISSSKIELTAGRRSRDKVVSVAGIDNETAQVRILKIIG
jgi:uncharacterized protein (TIGR00251 family)